MPDELMPVVETPFETWHNGVYFKGKKKNCKLCGVETMTGHPMKVCIFALSQKIIQLEDKLKKAGIQ